MIDAAFALLLIRLLTSRPVSEGGGERGREGGKERGREGGKEGDINEGRALVLR
jgi:hypothetical protein